MALTLPSLPVTPIQRIALPSLEKLGNRVFVKRDDLLPFSFGGNKVRIAREFLLDMSSRGNDALVMYGDLRSNLCRVLAGLCHELGVPCLMVATDHDEGSGEPSFNESLVRRLGVSVIRCEAGSIPEGVDRAMGLLKSRGLSPYYIYGNRYGTGNEGVGARAYAHAYREICQQERDLDMRFDLIVTPYGTGCTQGGLVCGSLCMGDERHIVGISISSRSPERARAVLEDTIRDWFDREGLPIPDSWRDRIDLQCGYNRGGYGESDTSVEAMVELMLSENSLPTDPTYTAKALLGLEAYASEHGVRNSDILFLHTGGLPLFFDYLSRNRSGVTKDPADRR